MQYIISKGHLKMYFKSVLIETQLPSEHIRSSSRHIAREQNFWSSIMTNFIYANFLEQIYMQISINPNL